MRLDYEMKTKEFWHCFNLSQGIVVERNKIKKNPQKRTHAYTTIIIKNYLLCLIYIPLIAFFDTLVNMNFITDILAILLLFIFGLNTILLGITIINFFKIKRKLQKGELRLEETNITSTAENGKTTRKNWESMDFIYIKEEFLFLITKKRVVFIIPKSANNFDNIKSYLKEKQIQFPSIKIIEDLHQEESKIKKHFLDWGAYVLLFLILMIGVISWENYNLYQIDQEMNKIIENDFEVENRIRSYEKYGKVEKELKDFFHTYRTNYYTYLENSATGIMYLLNSEFLEKNKDNLKEVIEEFPNREKKTEKAIEKIIELANQEKWIMNLEKMKLGDIYINLFKEYAFSFANNRFKREWERELYNNQLRMQYLTRMVEILTLPNACWYIEDNNLYFCDDAQLKEYNELYDLLMEENKQFSSGVKM